MANKYINTPVAVKLTGLSTAKILSLIHEGVLPAHKSRRGRWRISPQDLADLGLIKKDSQKVIEKSVTTESPSKTLSPATPQIGALSTKDQWRFIADDEHFKMVFKKMSEVKHSLKIATGDLKNFKVHVESNGRYRRVRLCDFFLSLTKRGVRVQIVCMKPFGFYFYALEKCPQLLESDLFDLRLNDKNHMKLFIFDDTCVYFGSANITDAAIGKREVGKGNHEAGMLVTGPNIIQEPLRHFDSVWNDEKSLKHTWKRFVSKAKEFEKLRG